MKTETTRPVKGVAPRPRHCRECGAAFWQKREDQVYCGAGCRRAFHTRKQERALRLYDLALTWRRDRQAGAFAYVTHEVDGWLAEDRARAAANKAKASESGS